MVRGETGVRTESVEFSFFQEMQRDVVNVYKQLESGGDLRSIYIDV